ncbi:PepSY domain-containing protein [Nonomuraea sp. SMC257]|uniref:PepSY domain-containing protein n=1 Tax=Nonomuraea montanisoli TaxID=2741721 RepID=A0A7Y6I8M3_9ACTN|nr:PepSY domain-containing protein [Nonomuraea montanisoli]NUW33732.1 PepSY domain-containing protein [Nonomuraea montanisoli]
MNGRRRTKTTIGTIFAGSALLAAAACGSAQPQLSAVEPAPAGEAAAGPMSLPGPLGNPSGDPGQESGGTASEKASAAAMNAVKGSKVLSVQSENGGQIWEVQLAAPDGTERLLEVDASGKVSAVRVKDTGKGEKARVMGIIKDAELTFEDAVKKVSSAVSQGKIIHMSLDRYNDKLLVWEADVLTSDGTWHGVKVDAKTGTVTKTG